MIETRSRSLLDLSLTELLKGSQINLAVTGLSRAGKTVFITSLIHNVLSALHQPHRMPLLNAVAESRLVAASFLISTEQDMGFQSGRTWSRGL